MPKNYKTLAERAQLRSNPENILLEKAYRDELSTLSYSDVLTYIKIAMKGVDPSYTQKSRDAGERVKEHLREVLNDISFEYQGSVMTETHIVGHSDIDLLVISEKFYSWGKNETERVLGNWNQKRMLTENQILRLESEQKLPAYSGNALGDLLEIRNHSEIKLKNIYIDCDASKPKAIRINNRSLNRDVDIVVANWYDDVISIISNKGENRGIQIYNKDEHKKEKADFPFISISRINERSQLTNGRLKKMIRLLKTVKADSEIEILLSSYDINAVCYSIEVKEYISLPFYGLIYVLFRHITKICSDTNFANSIKSVDEREYIFKDNSTKLANLRLVLIELRGLVLDLPQIIAS